MRTTFGALPVGTTFERDVRDKDPADKRRRIAVRWRYVKTSHGRQAGFAKSDHHGAWRSEHGWPVWIDATDFRLVVTVLRAQHMKPQ